MRFLSIVLLIIFSLSNAAKAQNVKNHSLIVQDLNGKIFDLEKQKGRVVIVNFWAYWCPNCAAEMQVLEKFYQENKGRGLEVFGLTIDKKREAKKVLQRLQKISYPNAFFIDAKTSLPEPDEIPQIYVFDRQGKLQYSSNSADDFDKKYFENLTKNLW